MRWFSARRACLFAPMSVLWLTQHTFADSKVNSRRVVVVGGGVCGLSTALTLQTRGHKVVVLERDLIGSPFQASSINSGFIEAHTEQQDDEDKYLLESTLEDALCGGSQAMYRNLHKHHDISFRHLGLLWIARSQEELKQVQGRYPALGCGKIAPNSGAILSQDQLAKLEPSLSSDLAGAVLFPGAATAHPRKAMLALAQRCRDAGVHIIENGEVNGAKWSGESWSVTAQQHGKTDRPQPLINVTGDTLVLASGALTPFLAELVGVADCGIMPVIGQMWATPPTQLVTHQDVPSVSHLICGMESSLTWSARPPTLPAKVTHERVSNYSEERQGSWGPRITRHLYGKQCNDGSFIFGGDRRVHPPQPDLALAHDLPRLREDMLTDVRQHVCEFLPDLAKLPVDRSWAGIMPFSLDGKPVVGRYSHAAGPDVWVCSGLGGGGFCRGPMAGKLLALAMDGHVEALRLLQEANPDRFRQPPA